MAEQTLPPSFYSHSPAHFFIASHNFPSLHNLLSSLPHLSPPSSILTISDSLLQSHLASTISSILDRRDVPHRDSPLHLAVRLLPLSLALSTVSSLSLAGADPSLPNSSGWTPLHLSLSLRRRPLSLLLLRHHRLSAHSKLRRRLPSLLPPLLRLPDFRLSLSLRFHSPLPFLSRLPSDDVRISKRAADVRADRRRRLSFLFKPDGLEFLVLDRDRKEVSDAFADVDEAIPDDCAACRPGVDVGNARLVPCTNWRRRERVEMVGEWRARVYEVENVVFSMKTLGAEWPELKMEEGVEEGFIVAEVGSGEGLGVGSLGFRRKEKEVVKNLKAMVWLTEDFPLKIEEIMPMMDILADKIKVVKQVRELLTTKFPVGTFPVKVNCTNTFD